MEYFNRCPNPDCRREPEYSVLGSGHIVAHCCKDRNHWFCDYCVNGGECPRCGATDVYWGYGQIRK